MYMLTNLMASSTVSNELWNVWDVVKIILLIIMAICAIFIIAVVLFQPGNSSGISALSGTSETFLTKNKGKTTEYKMKQLTVISSIIFAVLCIAFAIIALIASK